jgi:CMP-N-acetylneuraminic acid synthetase
MSQNSTLALIPARAGSKRLPGKNALVLGKIRLVEWTLAAALASKLCDRIILSSDDAHILELAAQTKGVHGLLRPAHLASDTAGSVDVALHALDAERAAGREWDIVVLLQPTSPFRAPGRIDEGIALLRQAAAPAIVGVRPSPVHPFHCFSLDADGRLEPFVRHPRSTERRMQDVPAAFHLTGSFYAIESRRLRRDRSFVPEGTIALLCTAPGEEIDIDTPEDFARAEEFLSRGGSRQAVT